MSERYRKSLSEMVTFLKRHGLVLIALVTIAVMSFHTIDEPDMGFHLSMGRWILTNRSLPLTDPLTYTVPHHEYIDMHWLYQIIGFLVWKSGGAGFYVSFHIIFIIIAFSLSIREAYRRKAGSLTIAVLCMLGAFASEIRFSVRPEVVSWMFLMLFVQHLEAFQRRNHHNLWVLPIIMLIWVNTQGVYILGLLVIICYLIDDLFHQRRFRVHLWANSTATFLVCLLNPYGFKGLLFPFLLATRLRGENRFALSIGEFLSPWSLNPLDTETGISTLLFSYYFLAILIPVLLLITCRKRPLSAWLMTALFGILAAQALRNIPLFFLVTLPVAAEAISDIVSAFRQRSDAWALLLRRVGRFGSFLFTVLILIMNILIVNGSWFHLTNRTVRFGTGFSSEFLPVSAVEFLNNNNIDGRILNDLRFGGFLSWKWTRPVFIDGRLEVMQHDFYEAYETCRRTQNPWPLVTEWHPQIVLFGYTTSPGWFRQFYRASEWRLVHLDSHTAIFVSSGFRDDIPSLTPHAIIQKVISSDPCLSLEEKRENSFRRFFPPDITASLIQLIKGIPAYPRHLSNTARALFLMDENQHAERLLLQAISESGGYFVSSWHRLGVFYMISGNTDLARHIFSMILSARPNDADARHQLEMLAVRQQITPQHQ